MARLTEIYDGALSINEVVQNLAQQVRLKNGLTIDEHIRSKGLQLQHNYESRYPYSFPDEIRRYNNSINFEANKAKRNLMKYGGIPAAKKELKDALLGGEIKAIGYRYITNPDLSIVPKHEWAFLSIDFENSSAKHGEVSYGAIRFITAPELAELTGDSFEDSDFDNVKKRKSLIPLQREANSALLLLYEIFKKFDVKYNDDLLGVKAWGKIISGEFKNDSIIYVSDTKKSITLSDGEKLTKSDFLEKYRKRFE